MSFSSRSSTLLAVVAGCILLSDTLPIFHKLWFVDESGKIGTDFWVDLLLLGLLFRQWQPARVILLVLTGIQTLLWGSILCYNLQHGSHVLGYFLAIPPLLLALAILAYSTTIKEFLGRRAGPLRSRSY